MLARGVGTIEVECAVEDDIARKRIARRLADAGHPDHSDHPHNASDATPELVDVLRGRRDAWPTATVVSTLPALDVVVARPFNHIGPRQQPAFAIASFARQIALIEEGLPVVVVQPVEDSWGIRTASSFPT